MSYTPGDLVDAVNIQENLDAVFLNSPDPIMKQKVPFLEYLMLPMNRGSLSQSVTIGNGQTRTVEVQYSQEFDTAQVQSNLANPTCTDGGFTPPNNSQEYTIDTSVNRAMEFNFNRADLETAKTTPAEYFSTNLLKAIAAVEVAVNTKEAAAAVALYGGWSTDVTDWASASADVSISSDQLVIKTRKDSSVDPYPNTAQNISEAAEYCGYTATPMVFSGSTLRSWSLTGTSGTFSVADYGQDLQRSFDQFGFAVAYDRAIQTALGSANGALMIQPGALQMLAFTASDWTDGIGLTASASNYSKATIFSPRTGLPMDVVMVDNCGEITVRVYATTKVVGLPTDMFNPNNQYDGVSFVNKLLVTNA